MNKGANENVIVSGITKPITWLNLKIAGVLPLIKLIVNNTAKLDVNFSPTEKKLITFFILTLFLKNTKTDLKN